MRRDLPLERIIAQTRLYVVDDALDLQGPRPYSMKAQHDALYRYALDSGLARWLTIAVGKYRRPPQALLDAAESRIRQVRWWPGNSGCHPGPDVLLFRTDSFENDWTKIRAAAEPKSRDPAIWHDDPALFTRLPSSQLVCRSACIGHEGIVYYLAFDHEPEWTTMLEQSGFKSDEQGRDAYLAIIRNPGLVAEAQ